LLRRLKVVVDEMMKAHQRQAKIGKKASLDYKVLPIPADRPEGEAGADTGRPRQHHG
jgi:hypothetical protein